MAKSILKLIPEKAVRNNLAGQAGRQAGRQAGARLPPLSFTFPAFTLEPASAVRHKLAGKAGRQAVRPAFGASLLYVSRL